MRMTGLRWCMKQSIAAAAVLVLAASATLALAQAPAQPPAQAPVPAQTRPAATPAAPAKSAPKKVDKPLWRNLTPAQQAALQPLQEEWDALDGVRKRKWLELANHFASMSPTEQERVHQRMREWMKLTPAQRTLARENYARSKKIDPGKKSATWQSYQQLPEDEKKKLAAAAREKKLAASAGKPGAAARPGAKQSTPAPACPAGSVRNTAAATPACVVAPARAASPTTAPVAPAPNAPNAN